MPLSKYTPYYSIVLNIDLDHVDYYKDIDDVIDAYTSYANNAQKCVVAYGDDPYTRKMNLDKKIVFFGGAGVSTESGLKDFRSKDGLYNEKYDFPPEEILSHHFLT